MYRKNEFYEQKTRITMKRIIYVLIASVFMLTSCVVGDGDIIHQERHVRDFNGISIDDVGDVKIYPGESFKVVVITDDNLQRYVVTETKNNVLHISIKSRKGFVKTKLLIEVHLPELQSLNVNGVGDVRLSDGNATDLAISLSGVGNIDARNYQIENVSIKHSGVGEVKIWATNSLSGTLSGVGDICYKGNPAVSVKVSGVGKVKKL
jgi:hypothetical protein